MDLKNQYWALTKVPQPKIHPPMKYFLANRPLYAVAINFTLLGLLSGGRENVFVITNVFKVYPVFPKWPQRADTIAKSQNGLHSDQLQDLESEVIADLCKLDGVKIDASCPVIPLVMSNVSSFAERSMRC